MLILCYDTETTGLVKGSDYTNPSNPYLASIAMILYDTEAQRVVASLNSAILPEGWSMPEDAGKVNGLTDEYLKTVGVPAVAIIPAAMTLAFKAELLIAHNIEFDTKILAAAMWRQFQEEEETEEVAHSVIKNWLSRPTYCTMKESKDIVQAKTANGRSKYPKLTEAYKHFFNKDLDQAHSANADAVAVLEIYMALQGRKRIKTYVTFGHNHNHCINGKTFDKDCVAIVNGGRDEVFEIFGGQFCFEYPEDQWKDEEIEYFPRGYITVD